MSFARSFFFNLAFCIFLLINTISFASELSQDLEKSRVKITGNKDQNNFTLEIQINKGWHIYGPNPGNFGIKTEIKSLNKNNQITNINWPKPEQYKEFDGFLSQIYKNNISINFSLKKNLETNFSLKYAVCGFSQCIPVEAIINYDDINWQEDIGKKTPKEFNLFVIYFISILGGIILNFMPCVLPVLSIKIISILNNYNESKLSIKRNFIATSMGIILCFLAFGLVSVILSTLGKGFGLGFHFQEPIFIITMILVLIIFAGSLRGEFEIGNFISISNLKFFSHNKYQFIKHLLSGCLATLLATPCSAPFIGTSLTFALSQEPLVCLSVFFFMGLGFASPYILLIFSSSFINFLPKPGKWMENIKNIMGFLLYLTAAWLLWILSSLLSPLASIMLFGLSIILKLAVRKNVKILIVALVVLSYYIPITQEKNEIKYNLYVDQIWNEFDENKISELVAGGKVVLVDISADWCITCKLNKIAVLDRPDVLKYLSDPNIYAMRADVTNQNQRATKFMEKFHRHAIPFNVIFGPKQPNGIVLEELMSKKSLIDKIKEAGFLKS